MAGKISARVELSGSGTSVATVQVVAENQEVEVHYLLSIETSRWAPRRHVLDGAPESMHAASTPHELSPPASLTSKLVRMPECRRSENRHYIGISAILAFLV